jgi:hypothetical protein
MDVTVIRSVVFGRLTNRGVSGETDVLHETGRSTSDRNAKEGTK